MSTKDRQIPFYSTSHLSRPTAVQLILQAKQSLNPSRPFTPAPKLTVKPSQRIKHIRRRLDPIFKIDLGDTEIASIAATAESASLIIQPAPPPTPRDLIPNEDSFKNDSDWKTVVILLRSLIFDIQNYTQNERNLLVYLESVSYLSPVKRLLIVAWIMEWIDASDACVFTLSAILLAMAEETHIILSCLKKLHSVTSSTESLQSAPKELFHQLKILCQLKRIESCSLTIGIVQNLCVSDKYKSFIKDLGLIDRIDIIFDELMPKSNQIEGKGLNKLLSHIFGFYKVTQQENKISFDKVESCLFLLDGNSKIEEYTILSICKLLCVISEDAFYDSIFRSSINIQILCNLLISKNNNSQIVTRVSYILANQSKTLSNIHMFILPYVDEILIMYKHFCKDNQLSQADKFWPEKIDVILKMTRLLTNLSISPEIGEMLSNRLELKTLIDIIKSQKLKDDDVDINLKNEWLFYLLSLLANVSYYFKENSNTVQTILPIIPSKPSN